MDQNEDNNLPEPVDQPARETREEPLTEEQFERFFKVRMSDGSFVSPSEYEAQQEAALEDQRKFNEWAPTQPPRPEYPKV